MKKMNRAKLYLSAALILLGLTACSTKDTKTEEKATAKVDTKIETKVEVVDPRAKLNDPHTEPMIPKWGLGYIFYYHSNNGNSVSHISLYDKT